MVSLDWNGYKSQARLRLEKESDLISDSSAVGRCLTSLTFGLEEQLFRSKEQAAAKRQHNQTGGESTPIESHC